MAGLNRALEGLNLSGVASTIAEGRRKDLAALIAANRRPTKGCRRSSRVRPRC
jgi:hypothetical protein